MTIVDLGLGLGKKKTLTSGSEKAKMEVESPPQTNNPPNLPTTPLEFEQLERHVVNEMKHLLPCNKCPQIGLNSKGTSGNPDARGVRRISIFCPICKTSRRLEPALEALGAAGAAKLTQLREAHFNIKSAKSIKQNASSTPTSQPKINFIFKAGSSVSTNAPPTATNVSSSNSNSSVNFNSSSSSSSGNNVVNVDRNKTKRPRTASPIPPEVPPVADSNFEILRKENEDLRNKLQQLTDIIQELTKQISQQSNKGKTAQPTVDRNSGSGQNGRFVPGLDNSPSNAHDFGWQTVNRKNQKHSQRAAANPFGFRKEIEQPTAVKKILQRPSAHRQQQQQQPQHPNHHINHNQQQHQQQKQQHTTSNVSYAAATAKQLPTRLVKRAASKLLVPVSEPLEFDVVRVVINDSRPLKNTRGKNRDRILQALTSQLGVNKFTAAVSTIGNAIVEIYTPTATKQLVKERAESSGLQVLSDSFDPLKPPAHSQISKEECQNKAVQRLAHLCLKARTVNLQDTILRGAPTPLKERILELVRAKSNNPKLTLGRQNHSHNLPETDLEAPAMEVELLDYIQTQGDTSSQSQC